MAYSRISMMSLGCAIVLAGCATMSSRQPAASALLEAKSGSTVTGNITVLQRRDELIMHVEADGFSPGSEHGFHLHDKGDCSAADGMSAGGHFNPDGSAHGRIGFGPHHSGDLGAVVADARGHVSADIPLVDLTVAPGPKSIVGHSVVIHRDRDDYVSQPAGNAGPRIACGVIAAR